MLLSPPEVLAEETDVAKRFLDFRARHLPGLRRVHVLARRGPRAAPPTPPRGLADVAIAINHNNTKYEMRISLLRLKGFFSYQN